MIGHEQYREDLGLYAVGALTPEEAKDLELHLAECLSCREELKSLQEAAAQIALAVEPVALPSAFRDQMLAHFERRSAAPQAERQVSRPTPRPSRQSFRKAGGQPKDAGTNERNRQRADSGGRAESDASNQRSKSPATGPSRVFLARR